jgi:hypothetical protein
MAEWCLDGKLRTACRYTTYKNCLLPTPEDRLLFILVYLKTYPLQVVQGWLLGMGQNKAHQWIHVLLVVLREALHVLGDAPTRSVQELAKRLGELRRMHATWSRRRPHRRPSPIHSHPHLSSPFGHDGTERRITRPCDRLSRHAVIVARKRATR